MTAENFGCSIRLSKEGAVHPKRQNKLVDAACQAFDLRRMLLFNSPRSILCRLLATKVRFGSGTLQSTQHIQCCAMGS
jgi:hypothetical protein